MSKKDVLASKRRRTERYRFEVGDPAEATEAAAEARLALLRARDDEAAAEAKKQMEAAEKALDACYGTITLHALPSRRQLEFQQEQAEAQAVRDRAHDAAVKAAEEAGEDPPEREPDPEPTWDAESFEVRLIAACDADGRTPAQWAAALSGDEWSLQEKDELLTVALTVNTSRRWDFSVLGKG